MKKKLLPLSFACFLIGSCGKKVSQTTSDDGSFTQAADSNEEKVILNNLSDSFLASKDYEITLPGSISYEFEDSQISNRSFEAKLYFNYVNTDDYGFYCIFKNSTTNLIGFADLDECYTPEGPIQSSPGDIEWGYANTYLKLDTSSFPENDLELKVELNYTIR